MPARLPPTLVCSQVSTLKGLALPAARADRRLPTEPQSQLQRPARLVSLRHLTEVATTAGQWLSHRRQAQPRVRARLLPLHLLDRLNHLLDRPTNLKFRLRAWTARFLPLLTRSSTRLRKVTPWRTSPWTRLLHLRPGRLVPASQPRRRLPPSTQLIGVLATFGLLKRSLPPPEHLRALSPLDQLGKILA